MWYFRCNHRNLQNHWTLKVFWKIEIEYILVDLKEIFPVKPSEFKVLISVERYDEKTAENYRNCYVAEKRIVFKLLKISIPNFNSTNWTLEWRLFKDSRPYFLYLPRNKPSKSVMSGRAGSSFKNLET